MISTVRISFAHEGNPNYPLPADYFKHEPFSEYARCARINACRQWLVPHKNDLDKAIARSESLRFFDHYYLWPDYEADYDPQFYDSQPSTSPQFHWDVMAGTACNRLNMMVAPRGSAKSTLKKKDMTHVMITRPGYSFVYTTSTHANAMETGELVRQACYENERVFNDFAQEDAFGGKIRPSRGMKPTATNNFHLNNGSKIRLSSAESRQRGMRPRRYILDDPEYDASGELSVSQLRENMSVLITKVIMPMIFRRDCGCDWIGTFVSKRHMLWQAMATYANENGLIVAEDPRFNFWNRIFIRAAYIDEETEEIRSCWPDMWPATEADKIGNPHLEGTVSLEVMEQMLTTPIFNAEMLGKPDSGDGSGFPDLENRKHGYTFHKVDDLFETDPWKSQTEIKFFRSSAEDPTLYEPVTMTLEKLFLNSISIQTLDSARTNKSTSDWKVCTFGCLLNGTNELFVFDIYGTKDRMSQFIDRAFVMCDKWHTKIMSPEKTSESENMINEILSVLRTRAIDYLGLKHTPAFSPFKPGRVDKFARIDRLTYRFEHGLLKLPMNKRYAPHWKELFQQIEDFVPDAEGGGLKKDDHVDTLSMMNSKLRSGDNKELIDPEGDNRPKELEIDIVKELREGATSIMVGGVDLRKGIDPRYLPPDVIQQLLASQPDEQDVKRGRELI